MGTKFRCLLSGNICEFEYEWDIEDMRCHPQYEEIENGLQTEEEQDPKEKVKKTRKTKEAK